MGDSLIFAMILSVAFILWILVFGICIVVNLYMANRRETRLKCVCGKRALLYWKDSIPTQYAYMCDCGQKGFIGVTKEETLIGWELRGNEKAYGKYLEERYNLPAKYGKYSEVPASYL